eukprot:354789-Chlamydomonas_euryale.AAC.2
MRRPLRVFAVTSLAVGPAGPACALPSFGSRNFFARATMVGRCGNTRTAAAASVADAAGAFTFRRRHCRRQLRR